MSAPTGPQPRTFLILMPSASASVAVVTHPRASAFASINIPIAVAREAAAAFEARRPLDPPLTTTSPHAVAASIATHVATQLPTRLPRSKTQVSVPSAAVEALV